MEQTNFISPFSYSQHEWKLTWKRVPSNEKYDRPFETQSVKEQKALEAIASVGVIGGAQLRNVFNLDKTRVKRMVARKQLVQHDLKRGDQSIPIYTIGKLGANKIMPKYIENYWVEYNTEEVLKRLAFFQLCYLLENVIIKPSSSPFIATLRIKNNYFYVYVTRGKVDDLLMFLKWNPFSERIIIIAETLNQLKTLEIFITGLKVRVIIDIELKEGKSKFYHLYEKEGLKVWVSN